MRQGIVWTQSPTVIALLARRKPTISCSEVDREHLREREGLEPYSSVGVSCPRLFHRWALIESLRGFRSSKDVVPPGLPPKCGAGVEEKLCFDPVRMVRVGTLKLNVGSRIAA